MSRTILLTLCLVLPGAVLPAMPAAAQDPEAASADSRARFRGIAAGAMVRMRVAGDSGWIAGRLQESARGRISLLVAVPLGESERVDLPIERLDALEVYRAGRQGLFSVVGGAAGGLAGLLYWRQQTREPCVGAFEGLCSTSKVGLLFVAPALGAAAGGLLGWGVAKLLFPEGWQPVLVAREGVKVGVSRRMF